MAFWCVEMMGGRRALLSGPSLLLIVGDALADSALGNGEGDRDALLSGVLGIGVDLDDSIGAPGEPELKNALLLRTLLIDALQETYSDVSKKALNLFSVVSVVFMSASVLRGDSDSPLRRLLYI